MNKSKLLSVEEQEFTFSAIRECFKDYNFFATSVADKLKRYLNEVTEINAKNTKNIADRFFNAKDFNDSPLRQTLFKRIDLIFKAAHVLILLLQNKFEHELFNNWTDMLEVYPSFSDVSDFDEQKYLLNFRNTIRIALKIIPASAHKQTLINIAGRLEGSECREYITGGGQKESVSRRVKIYELEGRIEPKSEKQKSSDEAASQPSKRYKYEQHNYMSPKIVKGVSEIVVPSTSTINQGSQIELDSMNTGYHTRQPVSSTDNSDEGSGFHQLDSSFCPNILGPLDSVDLTVFNMDSD